MAPEAMATDKAAPSSGVAIARPAIVAPSVEELYEGQAEMPTLPVIGPAEEQVPVEMPAAPKVPN
jgi:hypothetical protein